MKSDMPLDYAVLQLSPKRTRCQLIISSNGRSEKLASGLVKPFVTHLKVAEEQFARNVQSIKLDAGKFNNGDKCLNKGTFERFVRFVSTPEVLELVATLDAEMSQLEAARKIYSQGNQDNCSVDSGGNEAGAAAAADATKKELLRAIDLRLTAVCQDLTNACARASAAGFNPDSISELRLFADCFGAYRLNEACSKFLSLYQRRPELIPLRSPSISDCGVQSSRESDMSLDDTNEDFNDPQLKANTALSRQTEQNINQKDIREKIGKDDTPPDPLTIQTSQPTRRLSVQDRINLFESKKKDNTGSSTVSSSTSKPAVVKQGELRRLSSDVSSAPSTADRAVLRRWSGASDMSLDLSAEEKDKSKESPLCTPSSASLVSQAKSSLSTNVFEDKSPNETSISDSDKTEIRNVADKVSDIGVGDEGELRPAINGLLVMEEGSLGSTIRMDQMSSHMQKIPFRGRRLEGNSSQDGPQDKTKAVFGSVEGDGSTTKAGPEVRLRNFYQKGPKDQAAPGTQTEGESFIVASENETGSTAENAGVKRAPVFPSRFKGLRGHSRSHSEQLEGGTRLEASDFQEKEVNGDQSFPGLKLKPNAGVYGEANKTEGSAFQKMMSRKSVSSVAKNIERSQTKRDETDATLGNGSFSISSRKDPESPETSLLSPTVILEPVQRARQSKGNQDLNNDLQMKANELEKLFAEHKLRVPADQSSSRRGKTDSQKEHAGSSENKTSASSGLLTPTQLPERKVTGELLGGSSATSNFSTPPPMKIVDQNLDLSDSSRKNFSELNDSRGKFYETYMQKRNAKLREEWGSKRAEKEAKLKYMHDSLERSRAEMKARFSGCAERRDSSSTASRRGEKLRSFNLVSSLTREQHQPTDVFQSEEEELSGSLEDNSNAPDKVSGEASKKTLSNRNLSSSTPRTSATPASRSSAKASTLTSARRRAPSENPLAHSVPNFSDLRKENTKPASGARKTVNRSQIRSYSRSKSTSDDVPPVREERAQGSQFLRRSSAGPGEIKAFSTLNDDVSVLAPLELDEEHGDQTQHQVDDSEGKVVEKEEVEHQDKHSENPRLSHGSENSAKSGSDNGDSLQHISQVNPASVSSKFFTESLLLDSPVESPVSWNSRMHHPFSFPNETSDIDASVDSPMGSPASWNSHPLVQTEADAARMRKKWGSSQTPALVANSHNQPRKDMSKGFKRLLKFGRKSRGAETLVDWISVTTSEGDDDTEDGRDYATRSSEHLRKSRIGFPQSHSSDDVFLESQLVNDQAAHSSIPAPPAHFKLRDDHISGSSLKSPRSFFSLSTFRSKGSDAKLR